MPVTQNKQRVTPQTRAPRPNFVIWHGKDTTVAVISNEYISNLLKHELAKQEKKKK